MAFRIALDSPASTETVLAAIQEETREWRESAIPPDLRAAGLVKVSSRIKRHRFTLGYEPTAAGRTRFELVGSVTPWNTGSRMESTCGRPTWWIPPSVFGAVGLANPLMQPTNAGSALLRPRRPSQWRQRTVGYLKSFAAD